MSGELQTIPARHGVATFVPRGRTIKVINTYGKQVVSMWAFTLGAPPEEGDEDGPGDEEIEAEAKKLQEAAEEEEGQGENQAEPAEDSGEDLKKGGSESQVEEKEQSNSGEGEDEDPPSQAPDTPENETALKQPSKRTWASYLPSIPYRSKGKAEKAEAGAEQEPSPEEQKAQDEANTKKWSSYIPTGKGFSNYIPNVEVPSKEGVVSAFKSTHSRDPNKSYAEQLYDFSKTPVGAGTIAAATGSGYASSVYAAYSAYAQVHPSSSSRPPMEYLSLPHTRASSQKLVPDINDTLLTNLRNPILTLIQDTSPGAHDTLTAACDANLYASLGVSAPAEHGSCAENLVLALKELNGTAGLKGAGAVGADISVNIAPTPLHLFMAAPIRIPSDKKSDAGAKGARIEVVSPQGKKRSFVRFRAERDVVVVFSACPNEIGMQNGGRCMAANFMVEEAEVEGEAEAEGKAEVKHTATATLSSGKTSKEAIQAGKEESKAKDQPAQKKDTPKPKNLPPNGQAGDKQVENDGAAETGVSEGAKDEKDGKSASGNVELEPPPATETTEKTAKTGTDGKEEGKGKEEVRLKRKPKKLQVRSKP